MPPNATLRSLRTELLVKLALLATATFALVIGVLSIRYVTIRALPTLVIVAAGVALFVVVASVIVQDAVERPLWQIARAATTIARDDWMRRMPPSHLRELHEISTAFDGITSRALTDRAQHARAEKLTSLGRLSSRVATEIGNPLGAIVGHVHQLRKELLRRAAPAAELELLAAVERESVRLERVVRGLLDYAASPPKAPITVEIEAIIRSAVEQLQAQGPFEHVGIALELTSTMIPVNGHRHELEQLFLNVLTNAAEAMNGRGRVIVRLERAARFSLREPASRRDNQAEGNAIVHPPSSRAQQWLDGNDAAEIAKIVIADSGPGVPAALAERIFDPFFTTRPTGKNPGLGLAVAARIVENCSGAIWVTGSREGGAAFHILLPIVQSLAGDPRRPAATRRRYTPPVARSRISNR